MIEAARRSVLHTGRARRCAKSGKVGFSTRNPVHEGPNRVTEQSNVLETHGRVNIKPDRRGNDVMLLGRDCPTAPGNVGRSFDPGRWTTPPAHTFMSRFLTFSPLIIRPWYLYIGAEFPGLDAVGKVRLVVR